VLHIKRKLKAYDTVHELNQFTNVTRLPADPFMFMGKICAISENVVKLISITGILLSILVLNIFFCFSQYYHVSSSILVLKMYL
jgi:hypothetical protein